MTTYTTDPVTLQNGMPAKERNGLYGSEQRLIDLGVGARFQMVVTAEVADIRASEAKGSHYPLVKLQNIEPIWDEFEAAGLVRVQTAAKEARGDVELDVPAPEEPEPDFDTPLADKPADDGTVVSITKGGKK